MGGNPPIYLRRRYHFHPWPSTNWQKPNVCAELFLARQMINPRYRIKWSGRNHGVSGHIVSACSIPPVHTASLLRASGAKDIRRNSIEKSNSRSFDIHRSYCNRVCAILSKPTDHNHCAIHRGWADRYCDTSCCAGHEPRSGQSDCR